MAEGSHVCAQGAWIIVTVKRHGCQPDRFDVAKTGTLSARSELGLGRLGVFYLSHGVLRPKELEVTWGLDIRA